MEIEVPERYTHMNINSRGAQRSECANVELSNAICKDNNARFPGVGDRALYQHFHILMSPGEELRVGSEMLLNHPSGYKIALPISSWPSHSLSYGIS
jgi:hypothetical protein